MIIKTIAAAVAAITCVASAQTVTPFTAQPQAVQLQNVEYVIPELIIGGEWTSTIRFTNRGIAPILPTNVYLLDDAGLPLQATFQLTDGRIITASAFSVSLSVGTMVEATFLGSTTAFGSAFIGCSAAGCGTHGLYGEVALRNRNATRPDFESIFPFEAPAATQYMLFDGRNGVATTLYVVNNSINQNVISMSVLDTSGRVVTTVSVPFAGQATQIAALHAIAPQTIGIQGTLVFRGQNSAALLTVTGLRINPTNSFTPMRAFVPGQ
jgi:hypothetical protein